jgi:hypothetical protein
MTRIGPACPWQLFVSLASANRRDQLLRDIKAAMAGVPIEIVKRHRGEATDLSSKIPSLAGYSGVQVINSGEEQLENRRGVCLAITHGQIDRWCFTLQRTADHGPRQQILRIGGHKRRKRDFRQAAKGPWPVAGMVVLTAMAMCTGLTGTCTLTMDLTTVTGIGITKQIAALKYFVRSTITTFGILGVALATGQPTSGTAEESYPWCTQGSILRCYYMTREQCEEAVDYHGFCVANPNVPTLNNEAVQRSYSPLTRGRRLLRE